MRWGIRSIGVEVPGGRLDNAGRCEELQTDVEFLDGKIGTREVARMLPGQDTCDLAEPACRKVIAECGLGESDLDALVVCTQNPHRGGIPHTSAELHARLGLSERCACFDISLGCSGYVYGLSILEGFLSRNGMRRGLLVTADPYSKIIDPLDRNTVLLFGDAATATLLEPDESGTLFACEGYEFGTRGTGGAAICNGSGVLEMNGRAVFEFALAVVPGQVRAAARKAGWDLAEVDRLLLHQGSRFMVEQLARLLRLPGEKVPVGLAGIGNAVSSSIPLLLAGELGNPDVRRVILSGFGVGLSWASGAWSRS